MHLVICLSIILLTTIFWNSKIKNFFAIVLFIIMSIIASIIKPDLSTRFTNDFINNIPILNFHNNEYWGAWRGGIQQGINTPIMV